MANRREDGGKWTAEGYIEDEPEGEEFIDCGVWYDDRRKNQETGSKKVKVRTEWG
jgi:hypothetical protein